MLISSSNAGYTMFRGSVKSTGYPLHSLVFYLHLPSRASPCAITFQLDSTTFVSQAGEEEYPDEGCWNSLIHKEASETNGILVSLNTSGHMQCDRDI